VVDHQLDQYGSVSLQFHGGFHFRVTGSALTDEHDNVSRFHVGRVPDEDVFPDKVQRATDVGARASDWSQAVHVLIDLWFGQLGGHGQDNSWSVSKLYKRQSDTIRHNRWNTSHSPAAAGRVVLLLLGLAFPDGSGSFSSGNTE